MRACVGGGSTPGEVLLVSAFVCASLCVAQTCLVCGRVCLLVHADSGRDVRVVKHALVRVWRSVCVREPSVACECVPYMLAWCEVVCLHMCVHATSACLCACAWVSPSVRD